ncbi:MAG: DUF4230 domain-containing protein [Chitinophagales bacterium]|jgi:hypothetical protein
MQKITTFILVLFFALLLFLTYHYAFNKGKSEGTESFVQNYEMIKDIAEVAALQVDGKTQYQFSNKQDESSWSGWLSNAVLEKTVRLDIPYTAKYGIDLNKDTFGITSMDTVIIVTLPEPMLLSLEMKLDKVQGFAKSGLLVTEDSENYLKAQKELYLKTRADLETNTSHKEKAKESLAAVFKKYMAPSGKKVIVKFGGAPAKKVAG